MFVSMRLGWAVRRIVMATRWYDYAVGELQEAFPDLKSGHWNCRPISGTSTWSQHSWGNAGDLYHEDYGYSTDPAAQAFLDQVHAWIKTYQEELSIRTLIWRKRDHFNHIHIDGWPKGYGLPPCKGGSLRMQYNDGRVVNGDPGPANGTTELPDKELITVSDTQVLNKGDEGTSVADLQQMLIDLEYDLGSWDPFGPDYSPGADGQYGGATVAAVESFQGDRDLIVNGIADGVTLFFIREALGYAGQQELKPHEHGFVVNIPAVKVTATTEEAS